MIELIRGKPTPYYISDHHAFQKYCPHVPWPKQQRFLDLTCKEALYGGAAAGGKSEALLMAALKYIDVPGYAALILRKDLARLKLSGGLFDRSAQWFSKTKAVWKEQTHRWSFPTSGAPATISFGYLSSADDKYRYGSSEYQFIAFDELTEMSEEDYRFLFSRLRTTKAVSVPLRMRSATNPGGPGHRWVRQRFIPDENKVTNSENGNIFWNERRAYVPANVIDNPAIDAEEYLDSLNHLPSVTRQRLMNGDWSIQEEGLIKQSWLRYFEEAGNQLKLYNSANEPFAEVNDKNCQRIVTIDPAGTSEDRAKERKGQTASWSVLQVWDIPATPLHDCLLLRKVIRKRFGFDELCHEIQSVYQKFKPDRLLIENEKLGQAAVDVLSKKLPLETIRTGGKDKVARAAPLINRLEQGKVFLPKYENSWKPEFETELLSWTGLPQEVSDQIDAAAYAVVYADRHDRGTLTIESIF